MTGLLGGMSGRCGTLDNLHAGAATEGVSAGSMLVSRSGIPCGRNDDLCGDKDMAAAPWGRYFGGLRNEVHFHGGRLRSVVIIAVHGQIVLLGD